MSDQPEVCPGCGGVVDTARNVYVCGRGREEYSPSPAQCERHQKWDAQAKAKEIRAVADRLAGTVAKLLLEDLDFADAAALSEFVRVSLMEARQSLAEYRKAVADGP